jgi:hypothetical protein
MSRIGPFCELVLGDRFLLPKPPVCRCTALPIGKNVVDDALPGDQRLGDPSRS